MKKKLKILMSMVLSVALLLSISACQSPENNTGNDDAVTLAATEVISSTTDTTQNATATAVVTQKPTQATTVEPTNEPTQEPTKAPTQAPTATPTPTIAPQPTADPEIYPDDWGYAYGNNAIRTDGKVLFWTKTRHMVEFPEILENNYDFEFIDEENEQAFLTTGLIRNGTLQFYALRDGVFYKLSFGKVLQKSQEEPYKWAWLEEDGTVYSIGVRSKWFNEVYVESDEPIEGVLVDNGNVILYTGYLETTEVVKEDVLRKVTIISN